MSHGTLFWLKGVELHTPSALISMEFINFALQTALQVRRIASYLAAYSEFSLASKQEIWIKSIFFMLAHTQVY
jgi:hypothetical protein